MPEAHGELAARKSALRRRALTARAALPVAARQQASARIRAHLAALDELAGARTVIGYAAFGAEVDIDALLAELAGLGRGVFLPFVDGDDLGVARVVDLDGDLAPGYRGVREPKAIGRRSARPERVDVAVVPGVAFDRSGGRLGYGGGHFDRLLARLRPGTPVVGAAFEVQVVDTVPRGAHDRAVDLLVTEAGIVRVGH